MKDIKFKFKIGDKVKTEILVCVTRTCSGCAGTGELLAKNLQNKEINVKCPSCQNGKKYSNGRKILYGVVRGFSFVPQCMRKPVQRYEIICDAKATGADYNIVTSEEKNISYWE